MAHSYAAIDLPGKSLYTKEFDIKVRRITPIEQHYLISLTQKQQDTTKEYAEFVAKLIEFSNPEMTFDELYWYDVQYILYRIRHMTYSKYPIRLSFQCDGTVDKVTQVEKDGEMVEETVQVPCENIVKQNLEIGELQISTPDDLENPTATIDLDELGTVAIRNKLAGDDAAVDALLKELKLKTDDIHLRVFLLDLCLISGEHTLKELYVMAGEGTITVEDILAIEKWFEDNIWGVKETLNIKCPKCGKEASREYFISLDEFFSTI